jgi:hypothetical protein
VIEEFSSIAEIHDEVELVISLEGIVQIHNEGILDLFEYFSFSYK